MAPPPPPPSRASAGSPSRSRGGATLVVTFPLRYHRANRGREDRHWYAQLTRFLPEEVRARFAAGATYTDTSDNVDGAPGGAAQSERGAGAAGGGERPPPEGGWSAATPGGWPPGGPTTRSDNPGAY